MQHFVKKAAALAMAMVMALSLASVAFAADFDDMPDDWSTTALEAAVEHGLLSGKDGRIAAGDTLTRAELATIITRAFGASVEDDVSAYTDIASDAWYKSAVAKAVHMGAMGGVSATAMEAASPISRQQVFIVLARVLKLADGGAADLADFSDASDVAGWAVPSVAAVVKAGYVSGTNGAINPKGNITRAEFAQLMYNIFNNAYINEAGTYEEVDGKNVIISSTNVTLKGVDIEGDVVVADGVGDGDVFFDDVTIGGRLVVRGGGMNSIHFKDSKVADVIMSKVDGNVRLVAEGESEVGAVTVEAGKASTDVRVEGVVGKVVVNDATSTVVLADATVESVEVNASNATVSLAGETKVAEMTVAEGATKTTVNAEPNTEITKLETAEDVFINNEDAVKDCNDETKINPEGEEPTDSAAPTESAAASDPEDKIAHVHKMKEGSTWSKLDQTYHYYVCEDTANLDGAKCGEVVKRTHNWVAGTDGDEGKMVCKDCAEVQIDPNPVPTESDAPDGQGCDGNHVWSTTPEEGATEPTCTTAGVKVYKCTNAIVAADDNDDENGVTREGEDADAPTTCQATKTVTTPATGHSFDGGKVTKEATCAEKGEKTFTCTNAGCKKGGDGEDQDNPYTEKAEIPATGKHVGDGKWVTTGDDKHWQKCKTCNDGKANEASHTWTYKAAETGKHTKTCTICKKAVTTAEGCSEFTYTYKNAEKDTATCKGCKQTKEVDHSWTKDDEKGTWSCSNCHHTVSADPTASPSASASPSPTPGSTETPPTSPDPSDKVEGENDTPKVSARSNPGPEVDIPA